MKTFNIVTTPDHMPEKFLKNIRLVLFIALTAFFFLIIIGDFVYNFHSGSYILLIGLFGISFLFDKITGLKLKIIGRFSFDDLHFEKSIGDLKWTIDLEKIKVVNIEKHLVYLIPFFHKTMYRTFTVSLVAFDGTIEKFIVDNDNGLFMNEIKKLKLKRPDLVKIGKL
jgi:hypothetical protein